MDCQLAEVFDGVFRTSVCLPPFLGCEWPPSRKSGCGESRDCGNGLLSEVPEGFRRQKMFGKDAWNEVVGLSMRFKARIDQGYLNVRIMDHVEEGPGALFLG